MINDAQVFLSGYVATDPKFDTPKGTPMARMRIGFTARRVNRETGEWSDGPTSFLTVQCWRKLAENVAVCLRKGEPVLVKGRLQVRRYQASDGGARLAVEVDASSIGHDLNRGVAHFSRTHRTVGGTASETSAMAVATAQSDDVLAGPGEQPDDPAAPEHQFPAGLAGRGPLSVAGVAEPGETMISQPGPVLTPGIPAGGTALDERAVAEFAEELGETLGDDHTYPEPAAANA